MAKKKSYNKKKWKREKGTSYSVPKVAIVLSRLLNTLNTDAASAKRIVQLLKRYEQFSGLHTGILPLVPNQVSPWSSVALTDSYDQFLSVKYELFEEWMSQTVDQLAIHEWKKVDIDHIEPAGKSAIKSSYDLIVEKHKQIGELREQLKKGFDWHILRQIRQLTQQLHTLVQRYIVRSKNHLKAICRVKRHMNFKSFVTWISRAPMPIFKLLPDFSGCEEEEKFTDIQPSKHFFFTLQHFYQCIMSNFCSMPSIRSWNRYNINYQNQNFSSLLALENILPKTTMIN